MEQNYAYTTKAGTVGGTLLILLLKINFSELVSTALFAAVGASVSFMISILMKEILKMIKRMMSRYRRKEPGN